ncbi:MAG: hypothetical protein HKM04_08465 [Legionellales bacterium]|nr:hypothetical protein [Legionellales bacterium]
MKRNDSLQIRKMRLHQFKQSVDAIQKLDPEIQEHYLSDVPNGGLIHCLAGISNYKYRYDIVTCVELMLADTKQFNRLIVQDYEFFELLKFCPSHIDRIAFTVFDKTILSSKFLTSGYALIKTLKKVSPNMADHLLQIVLNDPDTFQSLICRKDLLDTIILKFPHNLIFKKICLLTENLTHIDSFKIAHNYVYTQRICFVNLNNNMNKWKQQFIKGFSINSVQPPKVLKSIHEMNPGELDNLFFQSRIKPQAGSTMSDKTGKNELENNNAFFKDKKAPRAVSDISEEAREYDPSSIADLYL